ncbi:heterodisulfide reductase subunit B [Desulfonispora thiosulfatigenes DSM 11270]|uniref:Heterodisulfide reductase subunit B n=1 Tax=Desulfonispora thiosulfatigenes DSM 11270 TaxID=656914 RepID=A0A1W1VUB7_DESTI|nr:CoB--CoM heterodisulfide reductase iron-sulfur subunit B family protein [Desulfonispora thiosulfatigenes]SMB96484.1 heterodisulfide reductase subunit B [Desulfonispora thiosulfatigenes DSM 11270]
MKYAYYPGCSLKATGIEYDMSTKKVCEALGIDLWEIPDWNCCGASSAHLTNHLLALALPARNLAIAEKEGLDVAISCAACYARCKTSEVAAKESKEMAKTISEVIERPYEAKNTVRSLVDIVNNDLGLDKVKAMVSNPLKDLKAVSYYGCLLVRPEKISIDNPEDPTALDKITAATGATPIEWSCKTECCGASHATSDQPMGLSMVEKILDGAKNSGADCIITACPMCMSNLDMRQSQVEAKTGKKYNIPVLYFTQLIGLAIGLNPKELGLDKHFVNTMEITKKNSQAS